MEDESLPVASTRAMVCLLYIFSSIDEKKDGCSEGERYGGEIGREGKRVMREERG